MPRNAATNRFRIRNQNASIFINGTDGAAGNALSIANNASLSPTAAVTLELWFRPIALKAGILFDNSTVGTTNSYFLSMGADGSMNWFSTIGGLSKTIVGTAKKAKFFEWNCVSATYNGSAVLIFLNGSQLAETLAATGSLGTNSGPLRIGAYYSGGISATFHGSLSSPRVYAAGCTLAEHQDRYYRGITSAALQAALVLDLNTERGASSTSNDLSGLGNNATLGASASWTSDSPFKSRKASVNANMVRNGDFEYAPPFTAVTTGTSVWIDGTASGSATNDLFGWYKVTGVAAFTASFDSTVSRSGGYSMKLDATNATGRGRVLSTPFESTTTQLLASTYGTKVTPNTTYVLNAYIKTTNMVASSARIQATEITDAGVVGTAYSGNAISGTSDWTLSTVTFTTTSTARYVYIKCDMAVAGNIQTAWFDDLSLLPVYPEGRVPANGNLVKNFDFEVAPTFVAATTTANRWIDGTAAGSTTNATYKWAVLNGTVAGTYSAQFDTSVSYNGTASMKVSLGATGSTIDVANVPITTSASLGIKVNPNTAYTGTYWMKTNYVSGSATTRARGAFYEYDAAGGNAVANVGTGIQTTTDWTQYTVTFTTAATTQYVIPRIGVKGNDGAATLIMDAWFDDIYLAPTTNPGRVAIT